MTIKEKKYLSDVLMAVSHIEEFVNDTFFIEKIKAIRSKALPLFSYRFLIIHYTM